MKKVLKRLLGTLLIIVDDKTLHSQPVARQRNPCEIQSWGL